MYPEKIDLTKPSPCLACAKQPDSADRYEPTRQPSKATVFYSHGQYGSTVFDEINGQRLEIVICDECLRKHSDRVALVTPAPRPPRLEPTYTSWVPPREMDQEDVECPF